MAVNKYLKPMLDVGSSRVFNCNQLTRRVLAKDPNARQFFRNARLNNMVLIKDVIPEHERGGSMTPIGTKLYFPFNDEDIYEGGQTTFLHEPRLPDTLSDHFGLRTPQAQDALTTDLRIVRILDRLPSLDPFLMKDVFMRDGIEVNEAYFDISPEQWKEIELFILQRFEPLAKAAFPDAMASDDKTRQLIEKIWEAKDLTALGPLIQAFRLPQDKALDIFASWKGINFYSYQYDRARPRLIELAKWLNAIEVPAGTLPPDERKNLLASKDALKEQLRRDWQTVEGILRKYQEGYDKMFQAGGGSADFLGFLRNCSKAYWDLGNCLGKANHAVYVWDLMTARLPNRKPSWANLPPLLRLFEEILQPEKKAAPAAAWA